MLSAPSGVEAVLVKVAVMVVALVTVTAEIVKPVVVPATWTVDPVVKFVPTKVTLTDVPRNSEFGVMDVSVGADAATTVNPTGPSATPPTVTVTL